MTESTKHERKRRQAIREAMDNDCTAIPIGFILFGALGVIAAVGLIELPAMLYSWLLLRRVDVLDLREELSFLALIAAGAAIGFFGGTEVLRLFPRL